MGPLAIALALAPLATTNLAQEGEASTWRAWFDVPAGELPFGLELAPGIAGWTGFLVNGTGRVPIDVVEWDGTELFLELSAYESRIRARTTDDPDLLSGEWKKVRAQGKVYTVPFHAQRGDRPRFPVQRRAVLPKHVGGRWTVDFENDELPAVALFEQTPGQRTVTGTFLTATGDYRWLGGSMDAGELRLSCFDGGHAFLFVAEMQADDTLAGTFASGNWYQETWTARRDDGAALVDLFAQTTWKPEVQLADLVFPDLNGALRSLAEPEYAGRAYVLQVFGSWCPNCHDETKYLVELHERYRDRGLSIVGLAFELSGDFERDREQVGVFTERYGVEYPILLVGTSDKTEATRAFGAVDHVRSYPTTIFLSGDGEVRAVHSGFTGPATGAEHTTLRARFEELIEELLSEDPGDEATWSLLTAGPWHSDTEFAGATYAFMEEDGRRTALYQVHGSGVPILSEETLDVTVAGNRVTIGDRALWLDRAAGVLRTTERFGGRIHPAGGSSTPLLTARGIDTEDAFVSALRNDDALVRREAIVALAEKRDPKAGARIPEVVPLLDDESLQVRIAATWAIGVLNDHTGRERVFEHLEHPSAALRFETVRTMGRLSKGNPGILLLLKPVENDPVQTIRELVMGLLHEGLGR